MEFNSNRTELPVDDFLPLMDMSEDVGDLFGEDDETWTSATTAIASSVSPTIEDQFRLDPGMNDLNLPMSEDVMNMNMKVIDVYNINDSSDLHEDALSDIESVSSEENNESPQKLMKMDVFRTALSSPPQEEHQVQSSVPNEAFNAQKRLEELRKLPIIERQREARKRHRASHTTKAHMNKLGVDAGVVAAASVQASSSTGNIAALDNDETNIGFNPLSEADTALIAQTTTENLKTLGIDPESKEGKKQRRKIRNRMSAQLHRERKKEYIDTLEAQIQGRDAIINRLQSQVKLLVEENETFRKRMNLPPGNLVFPPYTSTSSSCAGTSSASVSESSDTDDASISAHDNDTNDTSSPSPSSGHAPNISTLFSVFIMFGMTFWNAPTPVNNIHTGMGESISRFSDRQLFLPSPQERHHIASNDEVSARVFHGRRRLSVSSGNRDESEEEEEEGGGDSSTFKTGPLISLPNLNTNFVDKNQLWSYQNDDRIAQLYPLEVSRRPTLQTGDPTLKTSGRPSSGHLRKRMFATNDSTNTDGIDSSSEDIDHLEKKLNQYTTTSTSSVSAFSRIVLTSGKALLDPRMATNQNGNVKASVRVDDNDDGDNSKSIVPITSHTRGSFSSYVINHIREDDENVDPKTRQLALKETTAVEAKSGEPMLMMLLPASVVQWGTRWSNDVSHDGKNSFKNFMRNHNINGSDSNAYDGDDEDTGEMEDYFIEIGCNVFKAQLVKNVTMM